MIKRASPQAATTDPTDMSLTTECTEITEAGKKRLCDESLWLRLPTPVSRLPTPDSAMLSPTVAAVRACSARDPRARTHPYEKLSRATDLAMKYFSRDAIHASEQPPYERLSWPTDLSMKRFFTGCLPSVGARNFLDRMPPTRWDV